MIRSIKVDVNAAFPNMPLLPFQVFHGSAAAITVLNVPRRIESLSVKVKNVSAVERAFPAQRSGSAWVTIIPGEFLAQSGKSTRGVKIEGVDEAGNIYTVGAADLVVMLDDGTVEPVTPQGTDDTVTRTSANPVKSSGIWSSIWGRLAAWPSGFSSLYDWCAARIAALQDGKRDKDDLKVYGTVRKYVAIDPPSNVTGLDGQPRYWPEHGYYTWGTATRDDGYTEVCLAWASEGDETLVFTGADEIGLLFRAELRDVVSVVDSLAKESQLPTDAEKAEWNGKQSKITASGVLRGDGSGGVSAAKKSSTAQDPASADYRDPQDNTCHKTEFTEWVASGVPEGITLIGQPSIENNPSAEPSWTWWYREVASGTTRAYIVYPYDSNQNATELTFIEYDGLHPPFTATRSAVCTDGKKFVTEDVAAKQSDIPVLATPSDSTTDEQAAAAKPTYDFVNSSINAMAAFYITKNAAGDSFATKAELTAAISSGTFYNGGQPRTPTKNDYLYILADESHQTAAGTSPTTRYSFDGTQWSFQIVVNDTALTAAQLAAMNSGINAALVTWLTTFKGTDSATTLASILAAIAEKADASDIFGNDGKPTDTFATDLLGKPVAKEAVRYAFDSPTSSTTTTGTVETTAVTANSNTVTSVTIPAAASGNTPSLAIIVPEALGLSDVRDLIVYAVNADTANDCPIGIVGGTPVPQDGAEAKIPKGSRAYICVSKMPTTGEWFIQAVKLTAAA